MTREEAIAILQEEMDGNLELTIREWRERDEQRLFPAIRMAIDALQTDKAIIENIRVTMSDGDIFYYSADTVSCEEYEEVKAYMDTLVDAFIEDGEELAESVKVVRCKDCRHRDLFSCPLADNDFQKDEDFCSWGERSEPSK